MPSAIFVGLLVCVASKKVMYVLGEYLDEEPRLRQLTAPLMKHLPRYDRERIWVTYDPKQKHASSTSPEPQTPPWTTIPNGKRDVGSPRQMNLVPIVDLSKGQGELHVLDSFVQAYLPSSSMTIVDQTWTACWKDLIVSMTSDSALVRGTIAALGLACLGQQSINEPMIRQGAKVYGTMLSHLNDALRQHHDSRTNAHIIAAIQLMGLYEQYNGFSTSGSRSQGRNWQAHVLGMRRLMEILGPHAFTEDRAFFIFQAGQMSQFTSAFAARKASSLASREWRTIPWASRDKNNRDLFFDIVFPLPGVIEVAEAMNELTSEHETLQILKRLHQILARIEIWKCMVRLGSPVDAWTSEGGPGSTGLRDPSEYDLPDRQTAIFFAAVVVHTTCIWKMVAKHLSFEAASTMSMRPPNATPYALWIIQAIPSITHEGGIMGSQSVLFPMGAIRFYKSTFAGEAPEVTRMLDALFTQSTFELGYLNCMDGFLRNLTLIRTSPVTEVTQID